MVSRLMAMPVSMSVCGGVARNWPISQLQPVMKIGIDVLLERV